MAVKIVVKKNSYHDSVTLMSISSKLVALEGVKEAVVAMATDMNKDLLKNVGMLTDEVLGCEANDLVIAVQSAEDAVCDEAVSLVDKLLAKRDTVSRQEDIRPATIQSAVKTLPDANMAVISVPGQYAAREAMQALKQGLHVMLFSDNVSIEDEKALKEYAHQQGLLVMGPDCGTASINQVGLCFANAVRPGNIGIVGASGTGTQEIMVLVDRFGGGISQVIGTGGRDLTEKIGGIMMLDGLAALKRDEETKVIVLVSKPPAKSVAEKVLAEVEKCNKPVVVCFIHGDPNLVEQSGAYFASTLEDAAQLAVLLAEGRTDNKSTCQQSLLLEKAASVKTKLQPQQKYIRGLFCGGTLCDEAMYLVKNKAMRIYSNVAKNAYEKLADLSVSQGNTFIDLGDDTFTVGKPHPMIEPGLRLERIIQEARDPEVAVILLDIMLGYGSHEDPAGVTLPAIVEAKKIAKEAGRHLEIIAYVCGTDKDKQNRGNQEIKLAAVGVTLAQTNARAALLAAAIVDQGV